VRFARAVATPAAAIAGLLAGAIACAAAAQPAATPSPADGEPLYRADAPGTFELPVLYEAPDFEVRDAATGAPVALRTLRGRVVVLSLFYTHCPDGNACPLATATLRSAERALAEKGLAGRVTLLSVTFDEARDTPEVLRAHRDMVGAGPGWILATPETAERRAALLAAYDQRIARAPDGSIVHPLRVYVIDRRGRVRQIYSQSWLRADVLMSDVETLLAE